VAKQAWIHPGKKHFTRSRHRVCNRESALQPAQRAQTAAQQQASCHHNTLGRQTHYNCAKQLQPTASRPLSADITVPS
jgi:hypothetical protein